MEYIKDLVSVVILTYNYENIIAETLESVINQTYSNLEIIVTDDGSIDGTHRIIEEYAKKDPRIIPVLSKVNQGMSANINKGLKRVRGEFLAKLDGDDLMLPHKIETQVNFLRQNLEYVLCLSDMEVFDNDTGQKLRKLSDVAPLATHPRDWCLFTNWLFLRKTPSFVYSSVVARSDYLLLTFWDERVKLHNENLHLIGNYAIFPKGKWYAMQEVLGKYRYSHRSMSQKKKGLTVLMEEAFVSYSIAVAKYPDLARNLKDRRDYYIFNRLLYDEWPLQWRRHYERLFLIEAGVLRYIYLKTCIFLSKIKMLHIVTAPGRRIYRTFFANDNLNGKLE